MDKLLDILTEIEAEVEWSIYDGNDREKIMGLIHQAMDIAVQGKAHKWPEEKPVYDQENPKKYLVLDCTFENASYHPDGYFWTFDCGQEYVLEDVSYWWNLPEVTE